MGRLKVLGISGSLRSASYNTALLEALAEIGADRFELAVFDLVGVPMFDADLEADGDPEVVTALKDAVAAADFLVFATPEYNGGVPGTIKNAVDWASRGEAPIKNKPCAVIGGSGGRLGTAHAQLMLRHVLGYLGCPVMPRPTLMAGLIGNLFEDGKLVDDPTRQRLDRIADAITDWAARVA